MMQNGNVVKLRSVGGYPSGPAWTDAELMDMLNAEQITTLWTMHLLRQAPGWRPLDHHDEVRGLIDEWNAIFDAFIAAQGDADALRTRRQDLLIHARKVLRTYEEMPE